VNILVKATGALAAALLSAATVATYHSTASFQMGAPGVGMEVVKTHQQLADQVEANKVPAALPAASQDGQLAVNAYKNVQVLGHLSSGEFTRLMTAMTLWVAPDAGCAYCHAPERDASGNIVRDSDGYAQADLRNMNSDELYTKRVARRMLQMTQHINGDWKDHVKATGVTCYTCHRGQPVPTNIWFDQPDPQDEDRPIGRKAGQNSPAAITDLSSLPSGVFRPFLGGDENIRVQATGAIVDDDRSSIKQTEWTYGLMIHFSNSLGVNCTYCHNSRSMGEWSTSPSTRAQAWYGIRMVRNLNKEYLEPLGDTFPPNRHGAEMNDGPKLNCATCHNGAYKPLLGVSMLGDYQALAMAVPQPAKTEVAPAVAPNPVDGGTVTAAGDGGTVLVTADGGAAAATTTMPAADGGTTLKAADGGAAAALGRPGTSLSGPAVVVGQPDAAVYAPAPQTAPPPAPDHRP
jgi:photosynthetic reaction center cytochrome c subunit